MAHLSPGGKAPSATAPRKVPELGSKVFLNDLELRRLYRPGERSLRVPANAIISPLAQDWIDFNGVRVIRE